jgi:hypothetical protein
MIAFGFLRFCPSIRVYSPYGKISFATLEIIQKRQPSAISPATIDICPVREWKTSCEVHEYLTNRIIPEPWELAWKPKAGWVH